MKRVFGIGAGLIVATVALACAVTASAQPPEGRGGPEGGGPGGGQRRGPPSPERFVEHAMEFDADGDGKLDRSELTKFAEDIQAMRMRGGPGGLGGPGGGGGGFQGGGPRGGPGGGRGPRGEGQGGSGGPPGDGERPERPRRPE